MGGRLSKIVFIPDVHAPNHDYVAMSTLLKTINRLDPGYVVILGDFADFDSLSGHDRDRPVSHTLQNEVAEVSWLLRMIEQNAPNAKLVYLQGNHEYRLERYLMKNAEELYPFANFIDLVKLSPRWAFVPYRKTYKLGRLYLTHDTGKAGINAHRQARDAHMGNTIIGHTHRMAYEVKGTFQGQPHLAAMFGWLGDPNKAGTYLHEAASSDWAHGFGLGYMEDDGTIHVQPVPIINGKALVEGKLIG